MNKKGFLYKHEENKKGGERSKEKGERRKEKGEKRKRKEKERRNQSHHMIRSIQKEEIT
jgi:hypothetical protein